MEKYIAYALDKKGKIAGFPIEIDASNDNCAIESIGETTKYHAVQVWRGARQVGLLVLSAPSASSADIAHPGSG